MRREKTKISKIRNEKQEITIITKEIQGVITDYFENLYSNKLENLEKMDKFLDTSDHSKLNQENNHWNRSKKCNERVSQKRKVQYLKDSLLNSTRPLEKN
jgi:hypothetical protein